MTFKFGTDPEFFLFNTKTQTYVSAHNMVPGDKRNPHRLPDGSHVQADGTAVEFNTEPTDNEKDFSDRIVSALNEISKIIPKDYKFMFRPYIKYDSKVWKLIPEKAKELGCDPDYRIVQHTQAQKNKVMDPGLYRTGSGHIHIGWTEKADTSPDSAHFRDCVALIRSIGTFYENVCYSVDPQYGVREIYYGRDKAFRPKPYGVEFRAPSNAWLRSKYLHRYMFRHIKYLSEVALEGKDYYNAYGTTSKWSPPLALYLSEINKEVIYG